MPSHWFILIGFGFSQQQSELIFLSWNNSAPFVPLFYCLIPFILFYCQSFVSLGLQVISNPVGCYNKAFITQLPWFPCPFWSGARTCCLTWDFNPFGAPAASTPFVPLVGCRLGLGWVVGTMGWTHGPKQLHVAVNGCVHVVGIQVQRLDPITKDLFRVKSFLLECCNESWWEQPFEWKGHCVLPAPASSTMGAGLC